MGATSRALVLITALALAAPAPLRAQGGQVGGTYKGPGDTVPAGGSGGAGGGAPPPTGPAFGGPGGPAPGGGLGSPGGVGSPATPPPGTPPPGFPGDPTLPPEPSSPESRPAVDDPTSWQLWWHYNRWAFLTLEHGNLYSDTGASGYFLGRGQKVQTAPVLQATRRQVESVVYPALLDALARGGSGEFEMFALQALAKLRGTAPPAEGPDFVALAQRGLVHSNQYVSEKAALALGIRGEERYARWLIAILEEAPFGLELVGRQRIGFRTRAFAAYGLGLIAERNESPFLRLSAYEALNARLLGDRDEVQAACVLAIGRTKLPVGEETLSAPLEEGPAAGRQPTRADQVLSLLAFFADTEHSFVPRAMVPSALAKLVDGAPEALRARAARALLTAIDTHSSEHKDVQNGAVIALGEIGLSGSDPLDQEIRKELERVAFKSSGERLLRYLATISLAQVSARADERSETPLAGLAPTRKLLVRTLERARGQTLAWTSLALGLLEHGANERGALPDIDSSSALREVFLGSRSAEVAGAAALALGLMRDSDSVDELLGRLMESGEATTRGYTALALGLIGAPGAIEPLRTLLPGSVQDPFALQHYAIALALLGDQQNGLRLFDVLSQSSSPDIQAAVASAMGWIRDPRVLDQLARVLADGGTNDVLRAWTAVAIGRTCDEDPIPWLGRYSIAANYDVALPTFVESEYETGLLDLP